ncbi:MAG: arginase family protein, partial [Deltaproteobacteria bacterium]|nr:arginase family protein [Deltaproteobacteria bacterium]
AGLDVIDLGDLPEAVCRLHPNERNHQNLAAVIEVCERVAARVEEASLNDALPLIMGGDCTITVGAVAGLLRSTDSLGLLYMDGSPDLNAPRDSPTGILDSMGLTHLIGEGEPALSGIGPRNPMLAPADVVAFAFHPGSLNPPESRRLAEHAIRSLPVAEVSDDVTGAATRALAVLTSHSHVLVHFDVDVLEFVGFPAGNIPQYGAGLTLGEAAEALSVFAAAPRFAGLVVTEFNPDRDRDGTYAAALVDTLAGAVGGPRAAESAPHN